jgi:hypothetical protein
MHKLLAADGSSYQSDVPGLLGGYRGKDKLYGRLDCKSALGFLVKGHYAAKRVFFKDEAAAKAAGFRPCARCMPAEYKRWKATQ